MCAACIDFKDPDAPPVAVIIADIKAKRRKERRTKWLARIIASVCAFLVGFFTIKGLNEDPSLLLLAFLDLYIAWKALKKAQTVAERLDHTKQHLRLTEALNNAG